MRRNTRSIHQRDLEALPSELLTEIRKTREDIYLTIGYDEKIAGCRERTLLIANDRLAHLEERMRDVEFSRILETFDQWPTARRD